MKAEPAEARFLRKCRQDDSSCWEWTAGKSPRGYGHFWVDGKTYRAHRWAWEHYNKRSIPEDFIVCHTCDNPACVNPSHLVCRDHTWNHDDKFAKGRGLAGARHPKAIIDEQTFVKIYKEMTELGCGVAETARKHGIGLSMAERIKARATWKHFWKASNELAV